jgi:drug/metabolite transporter (DMT)-like permease
LNPPSRGAALALMIAAPFLWSMAGVVTRHIERATTFEQVFWRSLFCLVFVCAVFVFQGKNPLKSALATGRPGLFSGVMWATMFTAFVVALSLTSTANAVVTMSIAPLLTAFLAWIFLKESVPVRTWMAAVAAMIGMAWMFHDGFGSGHLAGMLVALLIPVASAANVIALRAAGASVDLIPALILGAAISCAIALPFAMPFAATQRDLLLLAFLGFFQLALPCMLMVIATRTLPAPEVALLSLLEVILGPLWAWLGAGETPAQATLAGGAIVLLALAVNELAPLVRRPIASRP